MHSRYRHLIPAFALALTASCSPIAYVDFPDGGGADEGTVGQAMTPTTITKKPLALARIELPVSNGPLPNMAPGIDLNLTLADPACPQNLADRNAIAFGYGDKCSRGTGIHEVSCRYSVVPSVGGLSKTDPVSALRFHEDAVLPYVIHSISGEFNAIHAIGSLRVAYRPPGAAAGTLAYLQFSSAKAEPAVVPNINGDTSSESVKRDNTLIFPAGTTIGDIIDIRVSATVQCIARKNEQRDVLKKTIKCDSTRYQCNDIIESVSIDRAEVGSLIKDDAINAFSWKLSGFSVDTTAR